MPRTVLLVEDKRLVSETLEIALARVQGIDVLSVATAEEALALLARGPSVCALITDLHLPAMDGFRLIEQVRAQPPTAHLPIIVISGDTDPQTPRRVVELGANVFFSKPYSPAEVRRKLERLIDDAC